MSVAIIGGIVGIAGTAYGAYNSKKATDAATSTNRLDEAIAYARQHPEAFGTKPGSWDSLNYTPVSQSDPGYGKTARNAILGNLQNLDLSTLLARGTNAYATEDAKTRIAAWDPTFQDSFSQQQQNTQNLLNGVLPFEDVQGIASRRSDINSILGGAGNSQQTAADLGLSRLSLMQQGQAALNSNADLIGRIDPFARRITPTSMFVDPNAAIQQTVAENWQDYQAASLERDASFAYEAMADPYQQGLLKLLAGNAGIGAGAGAGPGVNWGATATQLAAQAQGLYNSYQGNTASRGAYGGSSAWGTDAPSSPTPAYNSNQQVHNLSDQYAF